MEAVTAPAIGAYSEVGTLRTVIVHRPDLAHARLSPHNCQELLFDDVIWVRRAQEEFDAFVEVMRGRGVEVLLFHDLLRETLERERRARLGFERRLRPEEVTALFAREMTEWMRGMPADELATRSDRRGDGPGVAGRHGQGDRPGAAPDRFRAPAAAESAVHA